MEVDLKKFYSPNNLLCTPSNLSVSIDGVLVQPAPAVKNLGVLFGLFLYFDLRIRSLIKIAYFYLCNIARLQPFDS